MEAAINNHLNAYKLTDTVEQIQELRCDDGETPSPVTKKAKPVLYYTRTPYWISDVLKPGRDVVWLEVPFSMPDGRRRN